MDLYFLGHLCFFLILGRINNYITEKSLYFKKGPAIILEVTGLFLHYLGLHNASEDVYHSVKAYPSHSLNPVM